MMDKLQKQTNNKCFRDPNSFAFWCEVTSNNVLQFDSLEFSLGPNDFYYVSPDKYIDIVYLM